MTKGEYRVGINFNPSQDDTVGQIKRRAADFIDLLENHIREFDDSLDGHECAAECIRLRSLAQTHIEDAAMWAVKAVTKPNRE